MDDTIITCLLLDAKGKDVLLNRAGDFYVMKAWPGDEIILQPRQNLIYLFKFFFFYIYLCFMEGHSQREKK